MVHAPNAEKRAVQEGWAAYRTLIGSNEFYVVGPKEDPANISSAPTVVEAYTRIAKTKAKFILLPVEARQIFRVGFCEEDEL